VHTDDVLSEMVHILRNILESDRALGKMTTHEIILIVPERICNAVPSVST